MSFRGALTTSGNSHAIRFEAALAKAAPEFAAKSGDVRIELLGAGAALVLLNEAPPAGDDPMVEAWLRFIERDVIQHPERLHAVTEAEAQDLERLVEGVVVRDDETLPDDVTI
jgi:antitoxin PrlF